MTSEARGNKLGRHSGQFVDTRFQVMRQPVLPVHLSFMGTRPRPKESTPSPAAPAGSSVPSAHELPSPGTAFFHSVMASSPDCMKVLDIEARLVQMNENGRRLLGICDLAPYLNTCWVEWWREPERSLAADAGAAALAGGMGRFEAESRTPGG